MTVSLELFGVLYPVAVKEGVVRVILLVFVGVKDVFVGTRFVHEPLAVLIHPKISRKVELQDSADAKSA